MRDESPARSSPHAATSRSRYSFGCFGLLFAVLFSCVLLLINSAVVVTTLSAITSVDHPWLSDQRVTQFIFFTAPVLLLVLEWVLIDLLVDFAREARSR